jgi:hypothetical protein
MTLNVSKNKMDRDNIVRIILGTALILAVPLVAMMFSDEVDWNIFDFLVIGSLLISAGLLFEWLTTKVKPERRGVVAVIVIAAVLLIWVELAVGLFGSPFAGS